MAPTLEEMAESFRESARALRCLAHGNLQRMGKVLELYEDRGQLKVTDVFLSDHCLELANELESLAASLEAVFSLPHRN